MGYSEVALTCLASHLGAKQYLLTWFKRTPVGQRQVDSNITVTNKTISSELIFMGGFQNERDAGEYFCSVQNQMNSASAQFSIQSGDSAQAMLPCSEVVNSTNPFQIRVLNTSCNKWISTDKNKYLALFIRSITSILYHSCPVCYITAAEQPTCKEEAALFRVLLANPLLTENVYCALLSWHQSRPAIALDNSMHLIDSSCSLIIGSLQDPGCHAVTSTINIVAFGSASLSGFLALTGLSTLVLIIYWYVVNKPIHSI